MKISVLVNPAAGNGKTLKYISGVKKKIGESPHDFLWKISDSPDSLREEILNAPSSRIDGILLMALKVFQPFEAEIKIDNFHWIGRIMMVAISNGPYYGGGMKIAPDARMDDGRFNICIIQEVSKWELLREFPKVFRGTHVTHPKVILKAGQRVEVISDERREIFADGEYIGDTPCLGSIGNLKIRMMRPDK